MNTSLFKTLALSASLTLAAATMGCAMEPVDELADADEVGGVDDIDTDTNEDAVTAADAFCPSGFAYDGTHRLCTSSTEAVGPFTTTMINTCKQWGGGTTTCESSRWSVSMARSIRGTNACMPGSTLDSTIGYCAEGTNAFGPFTKTVVANCKTAGGGNACETMRLSKTMVKASQTTPGTLSVPYFYQYFNVNEPSGTCGVISAAMLLKYWGTNTTPDGLYNVWGKAQGQTPEGLAAIYKHYLGFGKSTRTGTVAQIKKHLDAGRPVVTHGYFTSAGHVVLVRGYDSTGFYFNDPSGKWAGCYKCGYSGRTSTNGIGVRYSYASLKDVISYDGDIWLSVGSKTDFTM